MILLSLDAIRSLARILTVGDRAGKALSKPPIKISFTDEGLHLTNGRLNRGGCNGQGLIRIEE